ncbi:MAG: hypothetical protein ABJA84_03895 [Polaromonas sp.]
MALAGGDMDVMFDNLPSSMQLLNAEHSKSAKVVKASGAKVD